MHNASKKGKVTYNLERREYLFFKLWLYPVDIWSHVYTYMSGLPWTISLCCWVHCLIQKKEKSLSTWDHETQISRLAATRSQLILTCESLFSQMMAVDEASRFHASLKKVRAHTRRLIVNQVLPPSASDCRFCAAKRRVSKLTPLSRHFPQF